MFTPILGLEVLNKATTLRFTDETGPDTGAGTKWDGVGGIPSFNVSSAILTVTDLNSTVSTLDVTATITGAWPITDSVVFADITGEFIDGFYIAQYDVWMVVMPFTAVSDYSGTVLGTIRFSCLNHNLQTGMKVTIAGVGGTYDGDYDAVRIDANFFYVYGTFSITDTGSATPYYSNLFSPFVFANVEMAIDRMLAVFCNMDEGAEGDEYLKQVQLLNGLLLALRSAITTTTVARINNIYGRITRMLDFNDIELTYS